MGDLSTTSTANPRASGRVYFWIGLALCLLGPVAAAVQFGMKQIVTPWYVPGLTTFGAILLLLAVGKRRSVTRLIALVLVVLFAGFQWYLLAVLMKLPQYEGPIRAGESMPAFQATLADGQPFTQDDLRNGTRHVLVFFRGRW